MAKTDDILGDLNNKFFELAGQVIEQKLNEKINNLLIGKDNLSPELKQMLMERQTSGGSGSVLPPPPTSTSIPTPQKSVSNVIEWNETTEKIVADMMAQNNVYLYGVAGTGKTVLAENIATYLGEGDGSNEGSGAGKRTINCSQWTSPTEIRGGQTITGYKQGTMILAWQNGDILILDELPKLDPNTAGILNDVLSKTADLPDTDDFGKVLWLEPNGSIRWTYTTDGAGNKIYKGGFNPDKALSLSGDELNNYINECYKKAKRFGIIGTGNTDMKTVNTKFGGNNRQDYSLVDRFSGAYYKITFEYTETFELRKTFSVVREFMYPIRKFLAMQEDVIESVSARTVLNVNRIYLQEMLIMVNSPLALKKENGETYKKPLKTFADSIRNFLNTLPETLKLQFLNEYEPSYSTRLNNVPSTEDFVIEFEEKYKINPLTGLKIEI
jgi:cobaltochelatase CobS